MSHTKTKSWRIHEIEREMYGLECGDDMLLSNTNGNLPRYRELQKELKKLQPKKRFRRCRKTMVDGCSTGWGK